MDYSERIKDKIKEEVFDCAEEELRRRGANVAKYAGKELANYSDVTIERGYKVSYELAETTLPPKIARNVEGRLRHSANLLKAKNRETIELETVALMNSSITALIGVAKEEQSFDEAKRIIAAQGKTAIKNVVIENVKEVAKKEAERLGKDALKKIGLQQIFKSSGATNPAVNALVLGEAVKDSVLAWVDGKISDEQFIKEVSRKCMVLVLQTLAMEIPGGVLASTAIAHACNSLFSLMDAAEIMAAADRRKRVAKIKSEALAEMERQRGLMKEYFADEKLRWDKNVQVGFELIADGTYSNDVEVIAQGLDKILQNFGSQVAFADREDFRRDFKRKKIVLNL